jgi:hypothetical protein
MNNILFIIIVVIFVLFFYNKSKNSENFINIDNFQNIVSKFYIMDIVTQKYLQFYNNSLIFSNNPTFFNLSNNNYIMIENNYLLYDLFNKQFILNNEVLNNDKHVTISLMQIGNTAGTFYITSNSANVCNFKRIPFVYPKTNNTIATVSNYYYQNLNNSLLPTCNLYKASEFIIIY